MPPKYKKQAEMQDLETVREGREESVQSEERFSTASIASNVTITSDHLERILEANQRSMAALIAGLSTASSSSSPSVHSAQIKPPRWFDDDTPHEYFRKFEKAMRHNKIDQREWGHLLPVYLTGKSFTQVEEDTLDDYVIVKERMLESLEDTPASADRRWWTLSRQSGEEIGVFYLRVHSTGMRRLYGIQTREEICEKVILLRFLSTLPPDCYNSVVAKQPYKFLDSSRNLRSPATSQGGTRHGGLAHDSILNPLEEEVPRKLASSVSSLMVVVW